MKVTFKTVIVIFNVDGMDYYTFANYDSGVGEATNCDRATQTVEKAIFAKGIIEAHTGPDRVFINMTESRTAAIKATRVVTLDGEVEF